MINCVKAPCKDCLKREVGCHDKCEDYKSFRTELSNIRDAITKAHQNDKYFNKSIAIAKKRGER